MRDDFEYGDVHKGQESPSRSAKPQSRRLEAKESLGKPLTTGDPTHQSNSSSPC